MSVDRVQLSEITNSLRTFLGYMDDLHRVKFDASSTKLRLVVNYAQKDPILRSLTEILRTRIPSEQFLELCSNNELDVPTAQLDRLAFAYNLLLHVKMGWKLNLREVLSRSLFAGGGMDQRWKKLVELFVAPLEEGLREIQTWFLNRSDEGRVSPDDLFALATAELFGGQAPAAAATPAAATAATAESTRSTPELRALEGAIRSATLGAGRREDLLLDAELLDIELQKGAPNRARIDELVASFEDPALVRAARSAVVSSLGHDTTPPPADPAPKPAAPQVSAVDLSAERKALAAQREALSREREALEAERKTLEAERAALAAMREALDAERQALEAQRSS